MLSLKIMAHVLHRSVSLPPLAIKVDELKTVCPQYITPPGHAGEVSWREKKQQQHCILGDPWTLKCTCTCTCSLSRVLMQNPLSLFAICNELTNII